MKDRFPEPPKNRPQLLLKAVEQLPDHDSKPPLSMPEEFWFFLTTKIEAGAELTEMEKMLAISNIDRIPDSLIGNLVSLFLVSLDANQLDKASRLFNRTLAPRRALRVLLSESVLRHFGDSHLLIGVRKIVPLLNKGSDKEIFEGLLTSTTSYTNTLREFSLSDQGAFTPLQVNILRSWFSSDRAVEILLNAYSDFWSWSEVLRPEIGPRLSLIDQIAKKLLASTPNWKGNLLDERSIIGRFVQDILKIQRSANQGLRQFPTLDEIVREYFNLLDSLKKISEIVPQRGEFWRNQLPRSSKVQTKYFKTGPAKVAVAMRFGSVVVVEFGPVGNAAQIYDARVFYSEVEQTEFWRVKDRTKSVPNFPDGRIVHHEGWMRKTLDFLRRELGVG